MKMKKLPDNQSVFFSYNYQNFVANIKEKRVCILEDIEQLVIGNMNERISRIKMDIADSSPFAKEIIISVNKYLEKLRQTAEKKEYFELCYNISQACTLISAGVVMYRNIEMH